MKQYYANILASHSNDPSLYVGVINDLEYRVYQHKHKLMPGFTADYNCDKLVYFEMTESVESAIVREKQLKNWHREWKLALIRKGNPDFQDLSRQYYQAVLNSRSARTSHATAHLRLSLQDDNMEKGVGADNSQLPTHNSQLGVRG